MQAIFWSSRPRTMSNTHAGLTCVVSQLYVCLQIPFMFLSCSPQRHQHLVLVGNYQRLVRALPGF